jgi:DNA-directed RNA polymerase subunit M
LIFCPKCGTILSPKKEKGKSVVKCSCGYTDKKVEKVSVKEKNEDRREIETVEEEVEIYPLVEDVECPKCGHNKAYFWEIQTRASDEPATKFLKCEKCKHTWRDYK